MQVPIQELWWGRDWIPNKLPGRVVGLVGLGPPCEHPQSPTVFLVSGADL